MIYCQRCKKLNPLEADHCEACGTYLLVISRTPDLLTGESIDNSFEEHLLERISSLELALARSNERFEQLLEIAQQQASGGFYDHMMISSLTEVLTESGLIDTDELEQRWVSRVARHHQETAEREQLDQRCETILAAARGRFRDQFVRQVTEGVRLLAEANTRRGLRMLVEAVPLDPGNIELRLLLGEYNFLLGRPDEARQHLNFVLAEHPVEFKARLLLGLITSESGENDEARAHLKQALAIDCKSFLPHFVLGQMSVRDGRPTEAIPHLKRALSVNRIPEMHYILGRVYQQAGDHEQAIRQLRKAIRLDPRFDVAQYCLGFLYWQTEQAVEARRHLRAAYEFNPDDSLYRRAVEIDLGQQLPAPPPFGWLSLVPKRRSRSDQTRFDDLLRGEFNLRQLVERRRRREIA
ncbi:MAG: tetratricopeptide repeat protein [Acidobacteria bacterium]|nr:tetratricopeptide repeat protein [Acidobacteriota bacterium]